LHLFQERKEKFRDPKVKKKSLWTEIANEFRKHNYACVTEDILDRKMRNMKKTYRTIKDNQKLSGRGRITWEYFETFENIFFDDKTMNIGPTLSSMQCTSQPVRKYTNIRDFSNAKYFEIFCVNWRILRIYIKKSKQLYNIYIKIVKNKINNFNNFFLAKFGTKN